MNKKRLLLSVFAALSACSLTFAFTACNDVPPSGQTPPGGTNPVDPPPVDPDPIDPNPVDPNPIDPNPVDPNPVDPDPIDPAPEKVDVGVFARKWYSSDKTLDLDAQTLTGADDFQITDIEGEGKDTVISCKTGEKTYTLRLTEDGKLGMYETSSEELPSPSAVFMVETGALAGSWQMINDSSNQNFYYQIDYKPTENGKFAIDQINLHTDESITTYETDTAFSFNDEGEAVVSALQLSYGYTLCSAEFTQNGLLYLVADYFEDVCRPYDFAAPEYETEEGMSIVFDKDGETVTVDGEKVSYEFELSEYGAAYAFTANEVKYLLQSTQSGVRLIANGKAEHLYTSDLSALVGTWSNGDGSIEVTIEENGEAQLKQFGVNTQISLNRNLKDGEVTYSFTRGQHIVTLKPIAGIGAAIELQSDNNDYNGYYINTLARAEFFDSFTNNLQTMTITSDHSVAVSDIGSTAEAKTYKGEFGYEPELECVFFVYNEISPTVVLFIEQGALMEANGTYVWLNGEALQNMHNKLAAGLQGADDAFTSGKYGNSLSFDFSGAVSTVTIDGEENPFFWSADLSDDGQRYLVEAYFFYGEETDRHIAIALPEQKGVFVKTYELLNDEPVESSEKYIYFVSRETYEAHLGLSFTYSGAYANETMTLTSDGKFLLSSTNTDATDSLTTLQEYEYHLYVLDDGRLGIQFDVNSSVWPFAYVATDKNSANVFDYSYVRADFAPFIGTYVAEDGSSIVLSDKGAISYNSADGFPNFATLKGEMTVTDGVLTATLSVGFMELATDYTLTFTATQAKLTKISDPTVTIGFAKREKLNPFAFVGSYTFGDNKVELFVSVQGLNTVPTLSGTINGSDISYGTFGYGANGTQVYSFFDDDFNSYRFTLSGTTLTAKFGADEQQITVTPYAFKDFAFEGTKAEGSHTLSCVLKENGSAPVFVYDGETCINYTLSVVNGEMTLTLSAAGAFATEIPLTIGADGEIEVGFPSEIPLPPPPPPPPAPPLF